MLNKKGFGLKQMLLLSGILILFLFIAIYYIYILYSNLDKSLTNNYYHELENDLKEQAQVYLNDYYNASLSSDYITIRRDVLRAYNLDINLKDKENRACSGYVKANKDNINAYISCRDYETKGYESWRG